MNIVFIKENKLIRILVSLLFCLYSLFDYFYIFFIVKFCIFLDICFIFIFIYDNI